MNLTNDVQAKNNWNINKYKSMCNRGTKNVLWFIHQCINSRAACHMIKTLFTEANSSTIYASLLLESF